MRSLVVVVVAVVGCSSNPDLARRDQAVARSTPLTTSLRDMFSSPLNAPLNAMKNAPLYAPMSSSRTQNLDATIEAALAGSGFAAMTVKNAAVDTVTDGQVPLLLAQGVDQLGRSLDAGNRRGTAATLFGGGSLAQHTLAEIEAACPATTFADVPLPNNSSVDVYLPQLTVFRKETLIDLTPNGIGGGIDTDEDGQLEVDWHVYGATMLACDDVMTNVVLLGKPWSGGWKGIQVAGRLRPYEADLQYICIKSTDATDARPRWNCLRGTVSEGVIGFARRPDPDHPERESPGARVVFASALHWGSVDWNATWMFGSGLAPIVARSPDLSVTSTSTPANPFWWNMNPNDNDGTPNGAKGRYKRFLAAIAVKSATSRAGLSITPYESPATQPESVDPDPSSAPASFPATPCEVFNACALGDVGGASRDCGWAVDEVYACTPGSPVTIGMGANAADCSRPVGLGTGDNILRICAGRGGCTHATALAESDNACGTYNPSARFVCPAEGEVSVMKATRDSSRMTDVSRDADGGGVPGLVGGSMSPVDHATVLDPCPPGASGERRDCGWSLRATAECTPGDVATISAAPTDDVLLRVCDGTSACTWSSGKRLGHGHDGSATITCGVSGLVAIMVANRSAATVPTDVSLSGIGAGFALPPRFSPDTSVDIASTGDLQNDFLVQVALPASGLDRSCDWGTTWGIGETDLSRLSWRVAASFDQGSTYTRCPSSEVPPEASCDPTSTRTVFVKLKDGLSLVPVGALTEFSSLGTTMCDGRPCCVAALGETRQCSFTTRCGVGVRFELRDGSNVQSTWNVVFNHDRAIEVDFRVPTEPTCNSNGICEPGEDGTSCPADCANPPFPDVDGAFASFAQELFPPSIGLPPVPLPRLIVPGAVSRKATGPRTKVGFDTEGTSFFEEDLHPRGQCKPIEKDFPPGDTTVTCDYSDVGGTARGSFVVTVTDVELTLPEVIEVADPIVHYPFDLARRTYPDPVPVGDVCLAEPDLPSLGPVVQGVQCQPPSGSTFPVGTTRVQCSVVDSGGTLISGSFDVVVSPPVDSQPPVLSLPADITALATSAAGATISYAASATDDHDGPVAAVCSPPSGSTFAIGTTTVTCTATDAAGNTSTGSFAVTVNQLAFCGIGQPINADGSSVFKLGSTVPVKFTLCTNAQTTATLSLAKISNGVAGTDIEAVSNGQADTGNQFRYDPTTGYYQFNLSTKTLSVGTWQLRITLGDGSVHPVVISLRK